ncbi:MAG: sporulation domain-containing protein, partial [Halanaerobium sp. T82-1]
MIKLNSFVLKIFGFALIILLLLAFPVSAEYYQSGLIDFIQSNHQITVPIFSPTAEISLRAEKDTVLIAAGAENLKLEAGKEYYITQGEINLQQPELKSGWGVQIMASSTAENASQFKNQVEIDFEEQIIVKEEEGLFKVLAGAFNEREQAEAFQQKLQQAGYNGWIREIKIKNQDTDPQQKAENQQVQPYNQEVGEGLNFYNDAGEKIRAAHVFKIRGQFKVEDRKMQGEFQFGPIGNSVLFSYKTN